MDSDMTQAIGSRLETERPRSTGIDPFVLERYAAMQRRADACTHEHTVLERLCVGGVIGAFVWLARDADLYTGTSNLVWFLPIVIAFYGALKAQALDARQDRLQDQLAGIEAGAGLGHAAGADHALRMQRPAGARRRWFARRLIWILFVGLTAGASMVGFESGSQPGDDDGDGDGRTEQTNVRAA